MTDQPTNERKFGEHTITLEPNWKFSVKGPEFDASRYEMTFQSLEAATSEISKRVEAAKKLAAQNVKLDITVLDETGQKQNITKINRTNGEVGVSGRYMYPNVPWVQAALVQLTQLKAQTKQLDALLSDLKIQTNWSYGRIAADEYVEKVNRLIKDYDTKKAEAEKLHPTNTPTLSVVK